MSAALRRGMRIKGKGERTMLAGMKRTVLLLALAAGCGGGSMELETGEWTLSAEPWEQIDSAACIENRPDNLGSDVEFVVQESDGSFVFDFGDGTDAVLDQEAKIISFNEAYAIVDVVVSEGGNYLDGTFTALDPSGDLDCDWQADVKAWNNAWYDGE